MPGLQDDLVLGQDVDFVVGAGDLDGLVGEDFHLVGVRLDGMAAGLGDALDAALVAVPAGAVADGDGMGVGGGDVQVLLAGQVQVLAGVEERAGGAAVADVAGGFLEDVRLGEAFGRVTKLAAAGLGFLGGLATDAALVFAVLLRVDAFDELVLLRVGVERQGGLLLGAIGEGLGGFGGGKGTMGRLTGWASQVLR